MIDSTATPCLLFTDLQKKPVVLAFDQRQGSSDGGAVLLQAANQRYELIESLAGGFCGNGNGDRENQVSSFQFRVSSVRNSMEFVNDRLEGPVEWEVTALPADSTRFAAPALRRST